MLLRFLLGLRDVMRHITWDKGRIIEDKQVPDEPDSEIAELWKRLEIVEFKMAVNK